MGASVTGSAHLTSGRECQDASTWRTDAGTTCLAVADGAGSKPLSAQGSGIAVATVYELAGLLAGFRPVAEPALWLTAVFDEVHRRIATEAGGQERDRRDFATTLAVAVMIGDTVAIGQIGDTLAIAGNAGVYETIAPEPPSEYANETIFVTHEDFRERLRIECRPLDQVDELFLSTDGLRYKILDDLGKALPYAPFFQDVGEFARSAEAGPESIERFLSTVDDQTGDDKSLVIAVRNRAC